MLTLRPALASRKYVSNEPKNVQWLAATTVRPSISRVPYSISGDRSATTGAVPERSALTWKIIVSGGGDVSGSHGS